MIGVSSAIAAALPLSNHSEGAILNNFPDYDWWYGCSPTSAGMMMAYYDINGYDGLVYDNLAPGGQAEPSTFPSAPGQWDYLAQAAIASPEHVSDFYVSGYDRSGDDLRGTRHDFDSLADFMGTSQDSAGNTNGLRRKSILYYSSNPAGRGTAKADCKRRNIKRNPSSRPFFRFYLGGTE